MAVLHAARRVFLDRGYEGATVDAIAEEAGFSKGVVYSQFGSKADMFMALLERRIAERGAQNERGHRGAGRFAGVRELIRAASQDEVAEQGWARPLVEFRAHAARDAALNQWYADAHKRTVAQLAGLLGRLHDRVGAAPAVPPQPLAEFVLAVGAGVTLERAASPAALPVDHVVSMLAGGVGGQSGPGHSPAGVAQPSAATVSRS